MWPSTTQPIKIKYFPQDKLAKPITRPYTQRHLYACHIYSFNNHDTPMNNIYNISDMCRPLITIMNFLLVYFITIFAWIPINIKYIIYFCKPIWGEWLDIPSEHPHIGQDTRSVLRESLSYTHLHYSVQREVKCILSEIYQSKVYFNCFNKSL